jgi:hypothetical protein
MFSVLIRSGGVLMELPVIIEPVLHNGYRAHIIGEQDKWSAEGATPDEALLRLEEVVSSKVAGGAQLASLSVSVRRDPLMAYAGTWKDHPLLDEWRKAIAEYRQKVDTEAEGH